MIAVMNDDTSSTLERVERKIHSIKNTLPKATETQLEPQDAQRKRKAKHKANATLLLLEATADSSLELVAKTPSHPSDDTQDIARHESDNHEISHDNGIKQAINQGLAAANQQVLQVQDTFQQQVQPEDSSTATLANVVTKTKLLKQMLEANNRDNNRIKDDRSSPKLLSHPLPEEEQSQKKDVTDWQKTLSVSEKLEVELLEQLPENQPSAPSAPLKKSTILSTDKPTIPSSADTSDNTLANHKDEAYKGGTDDSPEGADTQDKEDVKNKPVTYDLGDTKKAKEESTQGKEESTQGKEESTQGKEESTQAKGESTQAKGENSASGLSDTQAAQDVQNKKDTSTGQAARKAHNNPEDTQQLYTLLETALSDNIDEANEPKETKAVRQDNPIFHWLISPLTRAKARRAEKERLAQTEREAAKQAAQEALEQAKLSQESLGESEVSSSSTATDQHKDKSPIQNPPETISQDGKILSKESSTAEPVSSPTAKTSSKTSLSNETISSKESAEPATRNSEAKDIADTIEASTLREAESEKVLEQHEAILGDEAVKLEAEGIIEENPELEKSESTIQWWGDYQMNIDEMGLWQIGPTNIEIHRLEHEWRIITDTGDNPLNSTMEVFYPLPSSQPELESKVHRYMFHKSIGIVHLQPTLADRAIIVKPETPFAVRNGEQITMYVSTPIWIKVTTPGAQNPLRSVPSFRSPDIWYGEDTRTGELCYYSKLLGQLSLEGVQRRPYRAVTPLVLQNRSKEELLIERIRLPMRYLNLYAAKDNFLWTSKLYLIQRRNNHTRIRVDRGAPQEMGENHLITPAALKMPRYLRMSAFSRFKFARGDDS